MDIVKVDSDDSKDNKKTRKATKTMLDSHGNSFIPQPPTVTLLCW